MIDVVLIQRACSSFSKNIAFSFCRHVLLKFERNPYMHCATTIYPFKERIFMFHLSSCFCIALFYQIQCRFFFFYLSFLSQPFTNHRTAGKGGGHFFNSSLPLPPASQTFRYQSGNYCRELSSAHRKQPHLNRKPGFRAQVAYH